MLYCKAESFSLLMMAITDASTLCANIFNIGKDLWNDIMASGLFEPTGGTVQSGFCNYPIYKLIRQTA